jgi:GT2 family glycosyltransferase
VVARQRVLFAITVYNGRDFVPECLRSAAAMDPEHAEVDLLVLDDASPEPGFSEDIAALCSELGILYYRTPRNLGIPRNVNMGLLRAMDQNYDQVVIANSDVVFAGNLVDEMLRTLASDSSIGSVTSWSNNVSMFSLPNEDPDRFLANQRVVDWLGEVLSATFAGRAVDLPAGISFSFMMPVPVLREVGLMDPIFGRGYCEETDWSLRSLESGYRIALGVSCFTYHRGGGTNIAAGLVSAGHTTVPEHEEIIDFRYPEFRKQVADFVYSGTLEAASKEATEAIIKAGAQQFGYRIVMETTTSHALEDGPAILLIPNTLGLSAEAFFLGFRLEIVPVGAQVMERIEEYFGHGPRVVDVLDPFIPLIDTKTLKGRVGRNDGSRAGHSSNV